MIENLRIGAVQYSWNSTITKIDGQAWRSIVSIDWSEKLEVLPIPSNRQNAPPLGATGGTYSVDGFRIRMLREQADQLTDYLAFLSPSATALGGYGQTPFNFQLSASEPLIRGALPILLNASGCRIIGRKETTEKGSGVLTTEFDLWTPALRINGKSLYWAPDSASLIGGFPVSDSIQIGPAVMPGQWLLQPTTREFVQLQQQGWGTDGATTKNGGIRQVEASFLVRFWDEASWEAFQPLRKAYLSQPVIQVIGNKSYALSIIHKELNAIGVTSVLLKKTPAFTNDGKGTWSGIVEFLEFRPPKIAKESAFTAIPAISNPEPSARDNLEVAMATQAAEFTGPTR